LLTHPTSWGLLIELRAGLAAAGKDHPYITHAALLLLAAYALEFITRGVWSAVIIYFLIKRKSAFVKTG